MNVTFEQFLLDANLGGAYFRDLSSRGNWLVINKASMGEPLNAQELEVFKRFTERSMASTKPFQEILFLIGRQAGKSEMAAALAVYLAITFEGGRGLLPVTACDRRQAAIVLATIREIFRASPILQTLVRESLQEEIRLANGVTLRVQTCDKASVRGYRLVACVNDETSYWPTDGPNSDKEVYRGQGPGRITTGGPRITITTTFRRRGVVYELDRDYYGKDDERVLVVRGSTLDFNPTADPEFIEAEMRADRSSALCEFFCEYRDDLQDFIPFEVIERLTDWGVRERPFENGRRYSGFADVSGGQRDSGALAISYGEKDSAVLALARTWPASSNRSPQKVIEDMSRILKSYGVRRLRGDRYAANFVPEEFARHGITYEPTSDSKSVIYLNFLPIALSGKVRLLDSRQLREELQGLTRRPRSGGVDSVDHGPRGFDDLINAAAGSTLMALRRSAGPIVYETVIRRKFAERDPSQMTMRSPDDDDFPPRGRGVW